jgi:hypothetical protein
VNELGSRHQAGLNEDTGDLRKLVEVHSTARATCADGARITRRVEIWQVASETWTIRKSWCSMRVAYVLAVAYIPAVRSLHRSLT